MITIISTIILILITIFRILFNIQITADPGVANLNIDSSSCQNFSFSSQCSTLNSHTHNALMTRISKSLKGRHLISRISISTAKYCQKKKKNHPASGNTHPSPNFSFGLPYDSTNYRALHSFPAQPVKGRTSTNQRQQRVRSRLSNTVSTANWRVRAPGYRQRNHDKFYKLQRTELGFERGIRCNSSRRSWATSNKLNAAIFLSEWMRLWCTQIDDLTGVGRFPGFP
jgi:hypothetical protein